MQVTEDLLEFIGNVEPVNRAQAILVQPKVDAEREARTVRDVEGDRGTQILGGGFESEAIGISQSPVELGASCKVLAAERARLGTCRQPQRPAGAEGIAKFQGSLENDFSVMKFSAMFQPLRSLDRISFISRERSTSFRACALLNR